MLRSAPEQAISSQGWGWGNLIERLTGRGGLWRSLVAHLTGGQVVAGSNPVSPTHNCRSQAVPEKSGAAFFVLVQCRYSFFD